MLVSANANYTSIVRILFVFLTEFSFHSFLVYYKHNYFNPLVFCSGTENKYEALSKQRHRNLSAVSAASVGRLSTGHQRDNLEAAAVVEAP